MHRLAAVLGVAACLLPAAARAEAPKGQWKLLTSTNPYDILFSVAFLPPAQVVTGGPRFDTSQQFPIISTVLWSSADRGKSFTQVGRVPGTAAVMDASPIWDLAAPGGPGVWAAFKNAVWSTPSIGSIWKSSVLSQDDQKGPQKLKMFDALRGVAVGTAGLAWWTDDAWKTVHPVDTGVQADLSQLFFADDLRGWAAGARCTEEDAGNPEDPTATQTVCHEDVVLLTSDGGRSWSASGFQTSGHEVGPIFFLADGQAGWLATAEYDPSLKRAGPAHLWASTDGGAGFEDLGLDVAIGTMNLMGSIPINASHFLVMHWSDAMHGHVAGDAYILDQSSGGGSSTPPITRLADFVTEDGGTTWRHTDIGQVSMSLGGGGGPSIQNDYRVFGGSMLSLYDGFLVGEQGNVYGYQQPCTAAADCGPGADCTKKVCVTRLPAGCTATACTADGAGATDEAGGADGAGETSEVAERDDAGTGEADTGVPIIGGGPDASACIGFDCPAPSGGGCTGGSTPAAWLPSLLALLALASRRRPA